MINIYNIHKGLLSQELIFIFLLLIPILRIIATIYKNSHFKIIFFSLGHALYSRIVFEIIQRQGNMNNIDLILDVIVEVSK